VNPRAVGWALSAAALIGIAGWEGFRDRAYDDGVGVQTIGFGSTEGVKHGDTITVERALVKLGADVSKHEQGLRECVALIPLYQHEWDAFVSWTFNVGVGAACGSTLVKKLRSGDYAGACKELLRWDRAGGRVLRGLTLRRQSEYQRCIGA
jgi:lysozyme